MAGPTGPQSQAKKQSWGAAAPRLRFRSNLIKAGSQDQAGPQMPILRALSGPRHRQYLVARDFHVVRVAAMFLDQWDQLFLPTARFKSRIAPDDHLDAHRVLSSRHEGSVSPPVPAGF